MRLPSLVLLMICAVAAPAADLKPFQATFDVTWKGITAGRSHLDLEQLADGRWAYASRSAARGLFRLAIPNDLSQRSVFVIQDSRVVPEHFKTDYGKAGSDREVDLHFDWARGHVTGVAETKPVDLALQPGMQDAMSVQVSLMQELLQGRMPERILMIDKDSLREYVYSRQGSETLNTAIGTYKTEIFRSARPASEHGTWFWCVPELGYLPVKVERRNGRKIEWSMAVRSATTGTAQNTNR
jgi:Protein of unknown function (DUF3108)